MPLLRSTPVSVVSSDESLPERIAGEVDLARREIREGRFQRSMALITAFAAVVSGFEAFTQHQRGAFAQKLMWTPVWLTPPAVAASLAAVASKRAARSVLPLASLLSLVDGVVGFVYHIRGIRRLPGGFRLGQYNVVMGPPIFAPLLMCMVGTTGAIASLLRREKVEEPAWQSAVAPVVTGLRQVAGEHGSLPDELAFDAGHGEFQRTMALISAAFAVLAGGEAYVEHLRGSFNQRWMWTPIWVTPPMVAAGIGAACSRRIARMVLPFAAAATFFDGVLGFFLHLRGIKRMPGHFANLRFNITMGPPLFAPLLFTAVGLLGFIAALLRRPEDRP